MEKKHALCENTESRASDHMMQTFILAHTELKVDTTVESN